MSDNTRPEDMTEFEKVDCINRLKRELETTQLHLMEEETTRKIWEQDCKKVESQLAEARNIIDKTYTEHCGRDFMHLPLNEAVGAILSEAKEDRRMALIDEQHLVDADIEIKELKKELQQVKSEYQRMSERYAAVAVDNVELLSALDSYKQGVEVEGEIHFFGVWVEHDMPLKNAFDLGQRVKVLVKAIGSTAEEEEGNG